MIRVVALAGALGLFWAALSGYLESGQLLVAAAISITATVLLCWRMGTIDDEGQPIRGVPAWAGYLPWLAVEIVKANIDVAKIVWRPSLGVDPHFIRVPHDLRSARAKVTYANSITLTPGTVTVDVNDSEVLVHALSANAAKSLATRAMEKRVARGDFEPESSGTDA